MRGTFYLCENLFMHMLFFFKKRTICGWIIDHIIRNISSFKLIFILYIASCTQLLQKNLKEESKIKKWKYLLEVRTSKKNIKKASRANLGIKKSDTLC